MVGPYTWLNFCSMLRYWQQIHPSKNHLYSEVTVLNEHYLKSRRNLKSMSEIKCFGSHTNARATVKGAVL